MPIKRVEQVTYGVEDVAAGVQYFEDWGLKPQTKTASGADFRLASGQLVAVRSLRDSGLPPAIEAGSTVRELVWGLDSAAAVESLAAELSRDRAIKQDGKGGFRVIDDLGIPLGFRVSQGTDELLRPAQRGANEVTVPGQPPQIHRLAHIVFFCPPARLDAAIEFYTQRLGFRVSDRVRGMGAFLRAPLSPWHHNIFLLTVKPVLGLHHVAFDVNGIDDVVNGGKAMLAKGYTAASSLGRHVIGSSIHWYFKSTCGGFTEYACDTDLVDDHWQTRLWDQFPGIDQWTLTNADIVEGIRV